MLEGTSTAREVTVDLDAGLQSEVKAGDRVAITLPDNSTTPGVVTSVGTVATTPSSTGPEAGPPEAGMAATRPSPWRSPRPTPPQPAAWIRPR